MKSLNLISTKISAGFDILNNFYESRKACFSAYFFYLTPFLPLSTNVGVSQSCFDFVAAIFRLRKLLEFNKRFSQTKVCGYKKPNYDTVSNVERGTGGEVFFRVRTGVAPLSVEGEAGVQPQSQQRTKENGEKGAQMKYKKVISCHFEIKKRS
jgi:hypothetical protein